MQTLSQSTASRKVTVKDVARHAGVSAMTVSRVLRTPDLVANETREKVMRSVAETGYVPNRLAGSLSTGRSGQVAMLIPSVCNRIFADLIEGVSEELEAQDLQIIIAQFHYDEPRCHRQILSLMSWAPEALIITGPVPADSREMLSNRNIPVVEALELLEKPLSINVGISHVRGGVAVGEYLLRCGYRRVACICSTPERDKRAFQRVQGLRQVWREHGLPEPPLVVSDNASPLAGGHESMRRLLQQADLPEAVFCTNDELAFSAIMTARAAGLRVPEDMGFMGFNGLEISRQSMPTITTVHVDCRAMGRRCAHLLQERLNLAPRRRPGRGEILRVDTGFTLVEGQSTRVMDA